MAVIAIASQRNAEALGNNAMAITAIKILKNFPSCDSLGSEAHVLRRDSNPDSYVQSPMEFAGIEPAALAS